MTRPGAGSRGADVAAVAYRWRVSTFGPIAAARPARWPDRVLGRATRGAVGLGLTTAIASAVGVWLTWRIFVASPAGQRVDQAAFEGARYGRTHLWQVAQPMLDVISVPYVAVVLMGAVLIAVARRRWGLAIQVAALMGGSNLTSQILKYDAFDRPYFGAASAHVNTLPSGHTTAAASVSAALVFVVPPRARPWAAVLGAVYTAATGVSTLIGRWHRPSDVVAAVLVVVAWTGLACALAAATSPRTAGGSTATATAEFARPRSPEPGAREPGDGGVRARGAALGVGGGFLLLVALLAALPAGYAMRRLWTTPGALDTRAELLLAYAGGAFGVIVISSLAFAALLVVRHAAGRAT